MPNDEQIRLLLFNIHRREQEKKENKIQRSKELWEKLKSFGTPFSPKLSFIIQAN